MNTLAQLNTFSDEPVSYTDELSSSVLTLSDRYQINGLLDTAQPVLTNIDKLCSAAGSWLSFDVQEGKWGVVINTTGTSAASFSDKNIIGNISLSGTGLTNLYNDVKVQFPHRELKDSADFVGISIPSIDRNANEENNTLNLTYDIINDPVQAQLLGIIELKQSRVDLVIKFQTDYSYIGLKAGQLIDVLDTRVNSVAQIYRIISISEIQDDNGALIMEITALSYDPNVYSVSDLYKFIRRDTTGIITIGSIGVPGTPIVTKTEVDARPRISATSLSPTGIVEGIEFWITSDTGLTESNRTYNLIGVAKPPGGGVFTSGTVVPFSYDSLVSGNFLIKTRGFNSSTVGPYSSPSGFIYTPVQTTQAVSADTTMIGLVGALSLLELLNAVNGLFNGSTGTNSIFKKVFDLFSTATGVDLIGQASSGTIVTPSTSLVIKDEGSIISSTTGIINFVGSGVNVASAGSETVVQINCCGTGGGSTGTTSSTSTSICALNIEYKLPPDRTTYLDPNTGSTSDTVPVNGSFYINYSLSDGTMYGPLKPGSGLATLYTSDGTLVQTMSPSSITIDKNVVSLPFMDRDFGTDYYILIEEGFVKYCDTCFSPEIVVGDWNFNTPLYVTTPYSATGSNFTTPPTITATNALYVTAIAASSCVDGPFSMSFNNKILKGSGNVYIKKVSDLSTQAVIPVNEFTAEGNSIVLASLGGLVAGGTTYFVEADAGIVSDATISADCNIASANNSSIALTGPGYQFNIAGSLFNVGYLVDSLPVEIANYSKINPQTNIGIIFNAPIKLASSGTLTLYEASGALHQSFNVATSFTSNKTNEIIWTNGSILWLNPTKDLKFGTTYYVTATGDCVIESCDSVWGGTADTNAIRFTTDAGPSINTSGESGNGYEMSYDRPISANIYDSPAPVQILDSSNTVIKEIYPGDSQVTIS